MNLDYPVMKTFALVCAVVLALTLGCAIAPPALPEQVHPPKKLLIFGATGRIGGHIVSEALSRGYVVTGVSRTPANLAGKFEGLNIAQADILDRARLRELTLEHDAVLVSVGGKPTSRDPAQYIAARAAQSLIEVLSEFGAQGPRVLFVGNLYTLRGEDDRTFLEAGRAPASHPNYPMFVGHQIALDAFRASQQVNWTVASPPNGLRFKGRSGNVRWGSDWLLYNADGTPASISPEDFAYAMLEELEAARYLRKRYTVAR